MAKFYFIYQHSHLLGWYTYYIASLIIRCLFYRMIFFSLKIHLPISLLHWGQISFPGAFFWGPQTASTCWRLNLENRVGAEAIQSAIQVVLSSLQLTCNTVHCLGERGLFSSFVAIFWRFLSSYTPIMPYNIRYWWFFFSKR